MNFENFKYGYNIGFWGKVIKNDIEVEKIVRDFVYRLSPSYPLFLLSDITHWVSVLT